MMRYYLISEDWLISPVARRVYRACAWISFLLLPTIVAMGQLHDASTVSGEVYSALNVVLLLSVLATAVLCISMQFFLFVEDEESAWRQIFWFLALMVLGVGPGLYVFFGYSKADVFRTERANSGSATPS